ncbi:MAG: hypothetical protein FWG15_02670 [Propionibacteriaceae bacterium]|nr:hypothetical protein [Propionibacteriaceae bacterium]
MPFPPPDTEEPVPSPGELQQATPHQGTPLTPSPTTLVDPTLIPPNYLHSPPPATPPASLPQGHPRSSGDSTPHGISTPITTKPRVSPQLIHILSLALIISATLAIISLGWFFFTLGNDPAQGTSADISRQLLTLLPLLTLVLPAAILLVMGIRATRVVLSNNIRNRKDAAHLPRTDVFLGIIVVTLGLAQFALWMYFDFTNWCEGSGAPCLSEEEVSHLAGILTYLGLVLQPVTGILLIGLAVVYLVRILTIKTTSSPLVLMSAIILMASGALHVYVNAFILGYSSDSLDKYDTYHLIVSWTGSGVPYTYLGGLVLLNCFFILRGATWIMTTKHLKSAQADR